MFNIKKKGDNVIKKIYLSSLLLIGFTSVNASDLTLNASISVKPFCTTSVEDLDFGVIQLKTSNHEHVSTANITTQCNIGTDVTVEFDGGKNGSGSGDDIKRFMSSNDGSKLEYNIYYNNNVLNSMNYIQENNVETKLVTGKINLNQKAPAGDYLDIIKVNFIFE